MKKKVYLAKVRSPEPFASLNFDHTGDHDKKSHTKVGYSQRYQKFVGPDFSGLLL